VRPRLGLRGPELEQPLLHAVDHLLHLDHPHPDPQQPRLLLACVVMVRGVSLGCVRVRWGVCVVRTVLVPHEWWLLSHDPLGLRQKPLNVIDTLAYRQVLILAPCVGGCL
jgi:hypothetical protein